MGSPEEVATAGKPPNPKATTAPSMTAAALPPASPAMMPYPDWWAYYASGVAASTPAVAFFSPAAWGGQQLIAPYGTAIPFSPMYYAHSSLFPGTPYPNAESEGRPLDGEDHGSVNKSKRAATGKSANGGQVASGSADDDANQSGVTGSEGSSATLDKSTDPQDFSAGRKRTLSDAFTEGEASQAGTQYSSATSESSHSGRVPKLPVSALGRATLPGLATNLNIGMGVWNAPHAGAGPVKIGPNAVNIAPLLPGREGVMPEHQWMQTNNHELKREKRKQSNRESARRSRMRKQQECEELSHRVAELTGKNNALRVEVERRRKDLEELGAENASLMASLKSKNPDLLTDEEQAFLRGHDAVYASEGITDSNLSIILPVGEGIGYVRQRPVGPTPNNA